MDLQTHNAEDAEGIRAMMFDDVSDDGSADAGIESDGKLGGTERWRGVCRRRYVGWILLQWRGRY